MARKTSEPILWTLFSAGGVVAALFFPIHIWLFGIAFPTGNPEASPTQYEHLHDLIRHPLVRIYLVVFCTLPLFHAAHRLRFTLYDGLRIKHLNELINPICYGAAIVGSAFAVWLVWNIS